MDDVAFTVCEGLEPYLKAIVLNTHSPNGIWKFDHTFRYVKSVVATNPAGHRAIFYPFESFGSVLNEYAQPMWYGFLSSSSLSDMEPHLRGLLDRHRRLLDDPEWLPSVIYIDNCCDWCVSLTPPRVRCLPPALAHVRCLPPMC